MQNTLTILMAQINPMVGAIEQNADTIIHIINVHQSSHDLIIFPELALTGYPPEDLLQRPELFDRINAALAKIASHNLNCHVIIGHPGGEAHQCYNMASVFYQGLCVAQYQKQYLPNYGVFDEQRYFKAGSAIPCFFTVNNYHLGLCICEDIWHKEPVEQLITQGAQIILCINASPFDEDKYEQRKALLQTHARRGLDIVYVNQVGGQDSLVFDGQSLTLDRTGEIRARAPAFCECLETVVFHDGNIQGNISPLLEHDALVYEALVCGLRDYVEKNNFPGVLLGLSGGIDSALTLAIAVDALGSSRVHAVMMPSRFTADISREDALEEIRLLNVQQTTLSIEPIFNELLTTLAPSFTQCKPDTTEENLQARIRGILLMALSNKTGYMLLSTSNKSEAAVGYSTLYGDMCGGFSVLKDVFKTKVYRLSHYRNRINHVIPSRVLTRAPSAELASNQTDQDTLPDYETLDAVIRLYVHERCSIDDIIHRGFDKDEVQQIIRLIKRAEYKRQQSAPGIKITPISFDSDWRYPITSGF
jgi:NAD+ synthase (glutamine-hydrolysing)